MIEVAETRPTELQPEKIIRKIILINLLRLGADGKRKILRKRKQRKYLIMRNAI